MDKENCIEACSDILDVLKSSIEIPEGATNGYMVEAMFPNARVSQIFPVPAAADKIYYVTIGEVAGFDIEMRVLESWWNAPFKTDELVKFEKEVQHDKR